MVWCWLHLPRKEGCYDISSLLGKGAQHTSPEYQWVCFIHGLKGSNCLQYYTERISRAGRCSGANGEGTESEWSGLTSNLNEPT